MQVETRSPKDLIPYDGNAKKHPESQIRQLARSIEEWGFTLPILIDENNMVIAGHGRLMAALRLNMKKIPVIVAANWPDHKKRAYVLADNKLAEHSDWDEALLKQEIDSLLKVWDRVGTADLLGFDETDVATLLGGEIDTIVVPPGEGVSGRKSTKCKIGTVSIACTGEERDLLVKLSENYEQKFGMLAGFVGWLGQCLSPSKDRITAENRDGIESCQTFNQADQGQSQQSQSPRDRTN